MHGVDERQADACAELMQVAREAFRAGVSHATLSVALTEAADQHERDGETVPDDAR